MLPGPYAPIIPLGRGPCGHVSGDADGRRRVGIKKSQEGHDGEGLKERKGRLGIILKGAPPPVKHSGEFRSRMHREQISL